MIDNPRSVRDRFVATVDRLMDEGEGFTPGEEVDLVSEKPGLVLADLGSGYTYRGVRVVDAGISSFEIRLRVRFDGGTSSARNG